MWAVDPAEEMVTIFRPGAEPVALAAGSLLDGDDVLPGFTMTIADIFAQLQS